MTPAIKTQAIYGLVLEQTKKAQGDVARTSQDYANKSKELIAVQENVRAQIGEKLLPYKLKFVNAMISSVEWIGANIDKLMSWAKTAIWVGGAFVGLYGTAKSIIGIASFYDTVKKAIMTVRNSTVLATIAQGIFNGVAALNPFVWIAAVIAGAYLLIKHWDKVKAFFGKMYEWVKNKLSKFGDFLSPFYEKAKVWVGKTFDWIKGIFIKFGTWVINNHPLMWMVNIIDKVFPGFKQKLNEVFEWIKEAFSKLGQWIFDKVIGPIGRFFKAAATEYSKDFQPKVKQPQFAKPFQFDAVARVQTDKNFAGVTSFLYPGQKSSKNNQENIYDGTLKDLYADGSNPPGDNSKDKTSTVGDSVSGLVQAGGKEVKNITIRIENLVKQMDFNVTKTIRETSGQMKEEVVKALLTAVNDVNYQ
jgi:hypothetical protein